MSPTTRADHVGSLLRPPEVLAARQSADLTHRRTAEDAAVRAAVAMQEATGIEVISDGELRRFSWIASMRSPDDPPEMSPVTGFEFLPAGTVPGKGWVRGWRDAEGNAVDRGARPQTFVTQRIGAGRDIVSDEYGFLRGLTDRRTKYTFPAPSYHRIYWHPDYSSDAYPTVDAFLRDVRDYIREEVIERAIALGCDYVQLDAPNYGQFYPDPEVRADLEADGHDLDAALIGDAEIDNDVFEGVSGVTRALHVCRGNGPGGIWSATGGYDAFAEELFPRLHHIDTLPLEYDTPRAGDFSPLAHVLPHASVVLGLLTTKDGTLEDAATVEQRIHEAAQYAPLERLSLSPQCGFNSAGAGNPLTPAQQEAKLRLVVEVAGKVWGSLR